MARRALTPWREGSSRRGRRPGRGELSLCGPHRVQRSGDRREADGRPRRIAQPGISRPLRRPTRGVVSMGQASGLELHGEPYRPARLRGPGPGSHGDDGRFRTGRRPLSWLPLSFGFPAVLWGLLALPVIWWLLRLTPPRPQTEVFPPLKILARVLRREETPHQSPWWLTLLRLIMAALVVLALAEPIFNPREPLPAASAGLALVIDNGWASAPDWDRRLATAERILADAHAGNAPVILAFTAEKPNVEIGPFDAAAARDRLRAAV